jgi:peptidoglycan/xylan/chitin deacetylase (PgdA/CDA1 family)
LVEVYHSVSPYDEDPYEVTMTPGRFARHMRWLRGRGLRGVSMAELLSARAAGRGRGLVGLTFDDGYQDFVTYAVPGLQRYGFTATVFVLAGQLGGQDVWNRPSPTKALLTADHDQSAAVVGGSRCARPCELSAAGRHYVDTALRRIDAPRLRRCEHN